MLERSCFNIWDLLTLVDVHFNPKEAEIKTKKEIDDGRSRCPLLQLVNKLMVSSINLFVNSSKSIVQFQNPCHERKLEIRKTL